MDEQEKRALSEAFRSGLSQEIAPPPKWYGNVLFLIFGSLIAGILNLLFGNFTEALILVAIAIVAYFGLYFYRKESLRKAMENKGLFAEEKSRELTSYTNCTKCGKDVSTIGNLANMILTNISDTEEFSREYGIMCDEHASETTDRILQEKNLTAEDRKRAYKKAYEFVSKQKTYRFVKRNLPQREFRNCKRCGKETSLMGNYTNMFLTDILDIQKFDDIYGIMCSEHASECTTKIMQEKNVSLDDYKRAAKNALMAIDKQITGLT